MKLSKLLIIILPLFFYTSCKKRKNKDFENILNYPLTGLVSTLDPAISFDTVSATVIGHIYEPLLEYHPFKAQPELRPLLAAKMPIVSSNGKRYTIKIKENLKYHDLPEFLGKPRYVIAEDFINQIKRIAFIPTKSPGWWLFNNKIVGINNFRKTVGSNLEKMLNTQISGLKALDDFTLQIDLTEPNPQFVMALALNFFIPIPKDIILKYDNNFNEIDIGTGPFKLITWKRNNVIKVRQFKNYRLEKYPSTGDRIAQKQGLLKDSNKKIPFIEGINFYIYKENSSRWLKFLEGSLDLVKIPKDEFANTLDFNGNLKPQFKEKKIQLSITPSMVFWWISFNMTHPVLGKNLNFRKAIAHAIDMDKYIKLFTNNVGLKANSIYIPGIKGYDPTHKLPYNYNLENAKDFLTKAGYPNGKGLPKIKFDLRGNNSVARQRGEFIQLALKKIGIEIEVIANTFPGFLEKQRKGNMEMWFDGWSLDYPDAENILQNLVSKNHPPSPNSTYFSNKQFDRLFEKLKVLKNGSEKYKIMREMESIIDKEIPWIMQYYSQNYYVLQPHIKNFRFSDLIYNQLKYIRLIPH